MDWYEEVLPAKVLEQLHRDLREFRAGVGVYSDYDWSAYHAINTYSPSTETSTVVVEHGEMGKVNLSQEELDNMYVPRSQVVWLLRISLDKLINGENGLVKNVSGRILLSGWSTRTTSTFYIT